MNIPARIVGNKLTALLLIIGVGVWMLIIPVVVGTLGANPLEVLLHRSGEIAIWTLGAVLCLTPLRVLFPRSQIIAALNRHRRAVGVSACIYGLLHFTAHVLYEGGWDGLVRSLSKPFIWYGLAGLSILVVLAVTSNQVSIRKLGGRNWKRLHRLAYIAAALLIYHQAIKPETSREKDDHIGVLCRYFYDGNEQHAARDHLNGRVQSIAHRQSIRSCPEKLVSDKACNFHRQAHAEMPRDGAASFQINGRADAVSDATQKAAALFDLLLVPAIRRTASLPARDGAEISRARGRGFERSCFNRNEATLEERCSR